MDWIIRKGNIHDSRVSHGMVDSVRNFSYILADSAYDTSDIYDYVFENTHTLPIIDTNRRRGIVPDQLSMNRKIGIDLTYVYGNMVDSNMIPVLNAAPWLSSTAQGDFLGAWNHFANEYGQNNWVSYAEPNWVVLYDAIY